MVMLKKGLMALAFAPASVLLFFPYRGQERPAGVQERGGARVHSTRVSRRYNVTIRLQAASPFVPDGRHSLAEISFKVVFSPVTFEFSPDEDPLLGRSQVNCQKGRGTFSILAPNEVQKDGERVAPRFLSARPREVAAGLAVESEPMAEDEASARSAAAPAKVRLNFWTEFGPAPVTWGSKHGSARLADFKLVFEAPFAGLLQGKSFSTTLPYEGLFPEDKGTWTIEIRPVLAKK
jgi:hypothetical protein